MLFFLAGGVEQQVRQVVKRSAGRCLACGGEANLVEYDKVLKIFFIPTWKWPAKSPAMNCESCNLFFPALPDPLRCRFCHHLVEPHYRFCPFCASSL